MRTQARRLMALLAEQVRLLTTIHPSDRPWQMPFAAALATGLPLFVGAWFDRLDYGLISSLGGLVFIYLPPTPLSHRMVTIMACAFGMITCYTLGLLSQFFPWSMVPMLIFISVLVTMVCRFYRIGPPGSLFIIMAATIGMYTPIEVEQLPLMVGLLSMGALLSALVAFVYSISLLRLREPKPVPPQTRISFDYVVLDSVMIGVFVGLSLALAQALQMEKAYWVPVSCVAVIQGASLRAVWDRQLHRIIGTGIGLLVAWALLLLPLDKWTIPLIMMGLCFIVETAVVRHYAFAAIFITPLTILLAEAATLGQGSANALIEARFYDTVLGCIVGLVGAMCMHNQACRQALGVPIRRLVPERFKPNV
jgi:uncharacterized membrane protein YccC